MRLEIDCRKCVKQLQPCSDIKPILQSTEESMNIKMGYNFTNIKEIIENLNKDYYLPAIQREFVWSPEQIERLFDSIMSGYPIGTFLFWEVKKGEIEQFDFYKFIQNYEKDVTKNETENDNINQKDKITAILDGQQRLTSLLIGLKGSYSWKGRGKTKAQQRYLYLNLLYEKNSQDADKDHEYEFKFLLPEEAEKKSRSEFWFKVSDTMRPKFDTMDYGAEAENYGLNISDENERQIIKRANRTIQNLLNKISADNSINFYTERNSSIDKVLEIFVRVNSGGIKLSYSDLLLSMATATWGKNDKTNAREAVVQFLRDVSTEYKFSFDKDFIMKSWLYMTTEKNKDSYAPATSVSFEIKNFKDAMASIKNDWEEIKKSIEATISFIVDLGYSNEYLPSAYVLLPVALHHKLHGINSLKDNKDDIAKWISNALIKNVFSGKPDDVLTKARKIQYDAYNEGHKKFPLELIAEKLKDSKSIYSTAQDIEDILEGEYGGKTKTILSQLRIQKYASEVTVDSGHQDHIYPASWFEKKKEFLIEGGLTENAVNNIIISKQYNKLPNLALIPSNLNQSKSSKAPLEWFKTLKGANLLKVLGLFPETPDLSISNCQGFWDERKKLLKAELKEILIMRDTKQDQSEVA